MLRIALVCIALQLVSGSIVAAERPVAPNGIAIYPEYMTWKVIAPSYREDKGHIRIITGNEIAFAALRAGKDAGFVSECFGCHVPVANNDYLFTKIVKTP